MLGSLLLASLNEPFSGLRDGARIQFSNDAPPCGGALPGAFGVGCRVGDAERASHLPRLLRPVDLDGEAIPLNGLPLGGLPLRGLRLAEGLFSRPHLGMGIGLSCCDGLRPLGDGSQERRCGAPGLGDVLLDLLNRLFRGVDVPGGGALTPEPRRPHLFSGGVEMRPSFYEFLPVRPRPRFHLGRDRVAGARRKLLRVDDQFGVLPGFDVLRLLLLDESRGGVLEHGRVLFRAFDELGEACPFGLHETHRPILHKSSHSFRCAFGRVGEASVGAIAFHRRDELFSRLLLAFGDDVQEVLLAAASHSDVHARGAGGVSEKRVRPRHSRALDSVGGRRIGQVRVLGHILGRGCAGCAAASSRSPPHAL